MDRKRLFWIGIIWLATLQASHGYTFRTQWVPQAQFAGYYMAEKQGFYRDAGLDIEIKSGGPNILALPEAASGEVDFASGFLISALRLRSTGLSLVHVGQIFQKPAMILIARGESGIRTTADFKGRRLGVWPGDFQIPPKALLRQQQIYNVTVVQQSFSMEPFLNGEIDIASAMRYNEYHQVLEAGLKPSDLVVFDFAELGMNLPEDGIFVSETFYATHPDDCRNFIEASMAGWRYAFENKAETVRHVTALANRTDFKTTEKKQMIMLETVESLIDIGNAALAPADFETAKAVLAATKMMQKDVTYSQFTGRKEK